VIAWVGAEPREGGRVGINARNFDPAALRAAKVRRLDGADTWKYLE
jgi:hypothetical protein